MEISDLTVYFTFNYDESDRNDNPVISSYVLNGGTKTNEFGHDYSFK